MSMKEDFSGSTVTITGGTGSFGNTMVSSLLKTKVEEIRIFSRDENKQDFMRNKYSNEKLKFYIGDIRDFDSINKAIKGSNYVFHAAALKQVPSCEFFPNQAVATNIQGSTNVIESCINNGIKTLVCLSTDKAVYPINSMGMSKALMEKIAQSYARLSSKNQTQIKITRYGNVLMSRGSVVPLFFSQIYDDKPMTITNPNMSRFVMSLDESVDLVKHAFFNGESGDIFVKKASGCRIETLAKAVGKITGKTDKLETRQIGVRHGEKNYEVLVSAEEMVVAEDNGEYYRIPIDTRSLDYQAYFNRGSTNYKTSEAYTSNNTTQLSVEEVVQKIQNSPEFKALEKNE